MDTPQQYPTMWTTGYIGGVKVSFTFPIRNEMTAYEQANAIIGKLLADGFTVEDATKQILEAGHHREQVGGILRRKFIEDDGSTVSVIDIYPDNPVLGRRCVFTYLDDEKQIAEFEAATGLKLNALPFFDGSQLNRNEKPELAKKFVIPVKTNVAVVFKDNPAYDENASKKKAKHLFVRWESAQPAGIPTPPAPVAASEPDYAAIEKAEREKAAKALDNEAVTIFKVRYTPTHNGTGVLKWVATARIADGATIPVTVFGEDTNRITKAGYVWPQTDGDNLNISVITELRNGERRIKSVLPSDEPTTQPEPENAANVNVEGNRGAWDAGAWVKVMNYCKQKGVDVAAALGVSKGSEWKQGYAAAIAQIDAHVANDIGIDFMGEAS